MNTNNNCKEIELSLFFLKEDANKQPYSQLHQVKLLKELLDSGRATITISEQDFKKVKEDLEAVGIFYMVSCITEGLELEKDPTQEINFIVSKGILNKKKDKTVECYLLSKEEYNKLFAVKATLIDIIGTLKSLVDRC